ncbi:MAG: histidinol-phosphatase [Candidatus Neomarinimicrobiota bacterium]|nr:histidinol-phosphatase [Candidatus Neomarinimicrobiota bacterium]
MFSNCENREKYQWYKGNLHTHTFWSDGDAPPEITVNWYKNNGYDFLALSDHNILSTGEKWIKVYDNDPGGWPPSMTKDKLKDIQKQFGSQWVNTRINNDTLEMKLATLDKLKMKFESDNKFILIQSEEISDEYEEIPIHINATNLLEFIPPQGGSSVFDVLQRNIDAVRKQREETGQAMIAHINHPNYKWALLSEHLINIEGDSFFEVYNGHPLVNNWGNNEKPSTDKMWDIVLTMRILKNFPPMYGLAVDDAHAYYQYKIGKANPGRGWVMVKAKRLNADNIISSLESGNFYSTTGVLLNKIDYNNQSYVVKINEEHGVTYTTQFIGSRNNFDKNNHEEIGEILYQTNENPAIYNYSGNEMYVRAKITSSRFQENPYSKGDLEMAWTQPVILK